MYIVYNVHDYMPIFQRESEFRGCNWTKAILRVQVNLENSNLMDLDQFVCNMHCSVVVMKASSFLFDHFGT